MGAPVAILPLAPILIRSRRPVPTRALCTVSSSSVSGVPTWSANSSGAAPVPPSAPSTTMKSGAVPSSGRALHTARNCRREPTHSLKPAGLPPDNPRIRAMKRTSSRGVEKTRWYGGETTVRPPGTSRIPGVLGEPPCRRAPVEGEDGVGGERSEAHRGDVQQCHVVGAAAVRTADPHARRFLRHRSRRHRGDQELVAGLVHVPFGAVGLLRVRAPGALVLVDDAAHAPGRRGVRRSSAR